MAMIMLQNFVFENHYPSFSKNTSYDALTFKSTGSKMELTVLMLLAITEAPAAC